MLRCHLLCEANARSNLFEIGSIQVIAAGMPLTNLEIKVECSAIVSWLQVSARAAAS